jgi:hypothetical protein
MCIRPSLQLVRPLEWGHDLGLVQSALGVTTKGG